MGKGSSFVIGSAVGATVGVLAALMLSPNSGEKNRELVAEKAGYYSEQGADIFRNAASNIREKINPAEETGTPTADDIRAKINEARDRIAEQVARNTAAKDVEADVADVAEDITEAAESVAEEVQAD